MPNSRPLAAVTGASSGIGEVFARKLAERGYDLILIARRRERLHALAGDFKAKYSAAAEPLVADLAVDADVERAAERLGDARLTMLVNNAGFGVAGRFVRTPVEEQERMHRVHVLATVRLTHAALQGMVARDNGAIINVASVAAFGRSQGNVSYCATKSWMVVFTEGLYLELKGTGSQVRVQALCPGFTHTEFHDTMGVDKRRISARMWLSAEEVVEQSLAALEKDKLVVVPGLLYKAVAAIMPRVPTGLRTWMELRNPQSRGRV